MGPSIPEAAYRSGHILHAGHIQSPERKFLVTWTQPEMRNVLLFREQERWAWVLAEPPEGAVEIARYHHFRGRDHRVVVGG